jgi:hypothetical protein
VDRRSYIGPFWSEFSVSGAARDEPAVALSATGEILDSLPCRTCAYNLHGLQASGRCPECATSIRRSLTPDSLSAADPAWLGKLTTGSLLTAVSFALAFFGLCVASGMARGVTGSRVGLLAGYALLLVLPGLGVFFYTTPDPERRHEAVLSARRVGRFAVLGAMASTLGAAASTHFLLGALVLALPGLPALFLYTRRLLLRAGRSGWAVQAYIVGLGWGVALGSGLGGWALAALTLPMPGLLASLSCLLWLTLPTFLIWAVVVLAAMSNVLSGAADAARKHADAQRPEERGPWYGVQGRQRSYRRGPAD